LLCVFSAQASKLNEFPDCTKGNPVKEGNAIISGGKVIVIYQGLQPGDYAVAFVHDEDGDGQLRKNLLGIPSEGFGISNNPTLFGAPSFNQAKFKLNGNTAITVETKYF
jgi:uncharacterized protein (DUF2141 family)